MVKYNYHRRAFKMGRKKNNQVQLAIANYDNFTLLTQLKFLFHLCLKYP